MKYYIHGVVSATREGRNFEIVSDCVEAPFDTLIEAEEMCRKVIRSRIIANECVKGMREAKADSWRFTLTVVDENGQKVNDHYWYHELKVVKE